MNANKFSEALGNVRDDYVSEANTYQRGSKSRSWVKWGTMAACLCLVIAGSAVLINRNFTSPYVDDKSGVTGGGNNDDDMFGSCNIAVYPSNENIENVASAKIDVLTEDEALGNELAEHLPKQLPDGFHYGRGSIYTTVMKNGTQYNMLRIEYISGVIPEQQFTEDGGAIMPDNWTIGDLFVVCVMNYEPETDQKIYSSDEDVTLALLEENHAAYIRSGDCCIVVFTETAESAAAFEALKNIE